MLLAAHPKDASPHERGYVNEVIVLPVILL